MSWLIDEETVADCRVMAETVTMHLELLSDELPRNFHTLLSDAEADGHRHIGRLAAEFVSNRAMFHLIAAATIENTLVGIGAMTDEPTHSHKPAHELAREPAHEPAWRMRRLYVHRDFRRRGVGQAIAAMLHQGAVGKVRLVTVHAGNSDAAEFWAAMGFDPAVGKPWTHEMTLLGDA